MAEGVESDNTKTDPVYLKNSLTLCDKFEGKLIFDPATPFLVYTLKN